jgi:integrase
LNEKRNDWPKVEFKDKRAITLEEHQKIIGAEVNPERKTLYQLCRHLGASQGDIANLKGDDVDWTNGTVSFTRKKTGVPVLVHLRTCPAKVRCFLICPACVLAPAPRNLPRVAASLGLSA